MYTLDCGIFLTDLDSHHLDQPVCQALLERLHRTITPIVLPSLILVELASSISQELQDSTRARLAVSLLRSMPHVRLVGLNDGLAQDAVYIAADYKVSTCDAVYIAIARHYATTLVTLDPILSERVAAIVPILTPAELIKKL